MNIINDDIKKMYNVNKIMLHACEVGNYSVVKKNANKVDNYALCIRVALLNGNIEIAEYLIEYANIQYTQLDNLLYDLCIMFEMDSIKYLCEYYGSEIIDVTTLQYVFIKKPQIFKYLATTCTKSVLMNANLPSFFEDADHDMIQYYNSLL